MQSKLSGNSFLTEPEGEETAKVRVDRSGGYVEQLEERVLTLERERKQRMFAHEVVFRAAATCDLIFTVLVAHYDEQSRKWWRVREIGA